MEFLIDAILNLFTNLVFLASQGISVLGNIIALPGIIGLIIGGFIFWLAWRQTKSVLGATLWLVSAFLLIFVLATWVIWPFLFKGSENSVTSCYKTAGTNPRAIAVCDSLADGFVLASSSQLSQAPPVIIIGGSEPEQPPTVRTFKANALEELVGGWNLNPPSLPSDLEGQLVGPKDLPTGLIITFNCDNELFSNLSNEIWKVKISGEIPGIGQKSISLQTNGYFAKDPEGFNAKKGTSVVGIGTWETCPQCYVEQVVQPTPTPQPVVVPTQPTTKVPFPEVICGYWGWYNVGGNWRVVPTTGGQPDYDHASNKEAVQNDISTRCPGTVLPSTPTP